MINLFWHGKLCVCQCHLFNPFHLPSLMSCPSDSNFMLPPFKFLPHHAPIPHVFAHAVPLSFFLLPLPPFTFTWLTSHHWKDSVSCHFLSASMPTFFPPPWMDATPPLHLWFPAYYQCTYQHLLQSVYGSVSTVDSALLEQEVLYSLAHWLRGTHLSDTLTTVK